MKPSSIFIVILLYLATVEGLQGWASCFGDYRAIISANAVASGLGSFIRGEDFTYTTAICNTWQNFASGTCYQVKCTSGMNNLVCKNALTYVRSIDSLGNGCTSSNNHVFDLNDVPFDKLGTDGASCSGLFNVEYQPVNCQTVGLVSGGIKVGLAPNQVDPWCPAFTFSNVGDTGGLFSVSVSPDGGSTWYPFRRNTGNGARWDCNGGSGKYLGKSLSFRFVSCAINSLPSSCQSSQKTLEVKDFIPSNWCSNSASPCNVNSWQASKNFGSTSSFAFLEDEEFSSDNSTSVESETYVEDDDYFHFIIILIAFICVLLLAVIVLFQVRKIKRLEGP